jgi:hypothetical protein
LLAIRNSVLTEDDINQMRKMYKNNPYIEPEVLEPSKENYLILIFSKSTRIVDYSFAR